MFRGADCDGEYLELFHEMVDEGCGWGAAEFDTDNETDGEIDD